LKIYIVLRVGYFKMEFTQTKTIKEAQQVVKDFAQRNGWKDSPNIDKFDHVHEELLEMSRYLRYKNEEDRVKIIQEKKEIFIDGIGDVFFAICRLANQLDVDIEDSFNMVKKEIFEKYDQKEETKLIRD
jgi:NTP pyrophosphatase (non-canonical NTP hydrolase)